jgi:hypothetical protein
VSGSQLKEHLLELPEKMRDYTYVTYPFRLPQDERAYAPYTDNMLKLLKVQGETGERIVKHSYAVNQVLSQALMELKGNYYRDNLLDVIGMGMNNGEMGLLQEQTYPLYERLSFGPGQRYASKGCYIVQVGKGAKPDLIKKSDWVIH